MPEFGGQFSLVVVVGRFHSITPSLPDRHLEPPCCYVSYSGNVKTQSNIKFTIEFEQNDEIPFLDILLKRNLDSSFSTSIYRKKTFTGLYTKWDSFTPRKYKINLVRTLAYRCIRICSSPRLLQFALDDLKRILLLNG